MAQYGSRGYNPLHGFDIGPPPPPQSPSVQFSGVSGFGGFGNFGSFGVQRPFYTQSSSSITPLFSQFSQFHPGMMNPPMSHASIPPLSDGGFPGIHLKNHLGGVGTEPGYNYIFPGDHCKVHVFKTPTPPWQTDPWTLNPYDPMLHTKLMVPSNTTFKELMQNLGCDNSDAGKNILHEIQEAGNGKWVKGMTFKGDDKDRMKKTIASCGWNAERSGLPGKSPVVWVWATKD